MKVLFDFVYTSRRMGWCSTHFVFKRTAEFLLQKYPDMQIYYVVPTEGGEIERDDLINHPRCVNVPMPQSMDRRKDYFLLNKEWVSLFSRFGTYWDWDVLVTVRLPLIPTMRHFVDVSNTFRKRFVGFDIYPMFNFKKTNLVLDDSERAALIGHLATDWSVVESPHELDGVLAYAKADFSFSSQLRLREKMSVKHLRPIKNDEDQPFALKDRKVESLKRDGLKVIYCQRLGATQKRPQLVLDSFFYSFVADSGIKFSLFTNSAKGKFTPESVKANGVIGDKRVGDFIEAGALPREVFRERLLDSHIAVTFSSDEGMPLSIYESLANGVIVIASREPWSEAILGKNYPFLVSGVPEAVAQVKLIKRDYEKVYAEKFLPWYKDTFIPLSRKHEGFEIELGTRIAGWDVSMKERIMKLASRVSSGSRRGGPKTGEKSPWDVIQEELEKRGLDKFDFMEFADKLHEEGILRCAFDDAEDEAHWDTPLMRNPYWYTLLAVLRWKYGWALEIGVGQLSRTKPVEVKA